MKLNIEEYCDRFDEINEKLVNYFKELWLEDLSHTEQIKIILWQLYTELWEDKDPDKVLLITQLYKLEDMSIDDISQIVWFTKEKIIYTLAFSMDIIQKSIISNYCNLEYSTHKPHKNNNLLDIKT